MGHMSIANTGCFYFEGDKKDLVLRRTFQEIVEGQEKEPIALDLVSICEAIGSCAFLGDRTIIKNVKRTPWMSNVSFESGDWRTNAPPVHGAKRDSSENIASALFHALNREILDVVKGKNRIGILLSGGMDSRIVAGILRLIQRAQSSFSVTVFCWGSRNSRDPVYAERIANMYDWHFEHFDITAATLKRNIEVCANEGCFYSANHLHAMPDVADRAKELDMECMIAASYGDSIGRAEYSGTRVMGLPSIESRIANNFLLIDPGIYEECKKASLDEIKRYHGLFGDRRQWELFELDYQLHYMRNQLGTCMNVIDKKVPLYQAFTAIEVVGLMWTYHPECRGDQIYEFLLRLIDPELIEIPWARTGKRYLKTDDRPDDLEKRYHKYGKWCREDLAEYLDELIFGGELQKTQLLNSNHLRFLLRMNRQFCRTDNRNKIDEISLWLSSLALFLKHKDWRIEKEIDRKNRGTLRAYWKIVKFAGTFVLKHNWVSR